MSAGLWLLLFGCGSDADKPGTTTTPSVPHWRAVATSTVPAVCGVWSDGRAMCEGERGEELTALPTDEGWRLLALGYTHGCGLRDADGSVRCWGDDEDGEATPPAGGFVDLTASSFNACGIREDTSLECWGSNELGMSTPPGGMGWVAVDAGYATVCALNEDGTIVCWGADSDERTAVPPGTYTALSLGQSVGCGLRDSGELICWGSPVYEVNTPPAGRYTGVAVGWHAACALDGASVAACWGEDGENSSSEREDWRSLVGGDSWFCGLTEGGPISCFGRGAPAPLAPLE